MTGVAAQGALEPPGRNADHARTAVRTPRRLPDFDASVRALARLLICDEPGRSTSGADVAAVADYLLATCRRMPDHLGLAIRMATLLLDALPLLRYGRPLHALEPARQERLLARIERTPFGPLRSVVAFYRALAIYAQWAAAEAAVMMNDDRSGQERD